MNIFLDTTVTFSDPFLKKNYNRNLLKMVRDYKDITFYMSEIVYKETKRHFERNVKENLESLYKIERNLQNFRFGYFTTNVDVKGEIDQKVKNLLNDFETFYSDLEKEGSLHILSCPDNIISDLIHRSVNRIKPFKENKSEFRDAATWLTYARYAEQEGLSDCYFITENVTDFLDDKKENIHPHLLNDSKKFQHFLTLTKLTQEDENVRKYIEEKQKKVQKIQTWIEENNINEDYVIGYFKESSLNGLFNELYDICGDYVNSINRHHLDSVYFDGKSLMDGLEIINIQDFTIEIMAEEIIVSGELIIKVECSYLELIHLSDKDPLSVRESMPFSLELLQPFSFTMLDNKSITNLQFEDIKIVEKPRVDPTIHF